MDIMQAYTRGEPRRAMTKTAFARDCMSGKAPPLHAFGLSVAADVTGVQRYYYDLSILASFSVSSPASHATSPPLLEIQHG
jgi:hypothetical protein